MNFIRDFLSTHENIARLFGISSSFYTILFFLDLHAAPPAKKRFYAYLSSAKYENEIPNLYGITLRIFYNIFGERHLSKKCIKASVIFSTLSLILIFCYSYLYDPVGFVDVIKVNTKNENLTEFTLTIFAIWCIWCLVPDYISLLKTRMIINYIQNKKEKFNFYVFIIFLDFFAGTITFLISTSLLEYTAVLIYSLMTNKLTVTAPSSNIAQFLLSTSILNITFFVISATIFLNHGYIYWIMPYADLFWASMWPSAWLWSYIGASIIIQYMIKTFPVVRKIVYFLNFEQHPFRQLGFVGAIIIFLAGFFIIGALKTIYVIF
jgi:hypothetical protein